METYILAIPVDNNGAREICERFEAIKFSSIKTAHIEIKKVVNEYTLFSIADYVEISNNQDFESENYFITYINVIDN